ncbi:hypothetical protein [Secundilactobacillus mixtipabuli]|uniref:Uncharacterized protein n=1 Tax=Secundilactobacillus mixtipabuli TaxID=1435342 RepID=A0A1Z5IER9_9LACO|nr:hypothetical protein [Secundilactobacillus mixtipabuli]GAX00138.1 hypothetical protein IWT30_02118 [Secundilactobacillus mixtipabuli]
MQLGNENNKALYSHLFGRGWAQAMVRKGAIDELVSRANGGDHEAADYLRQYENKLDQAKRPLLFIKYKFNR